MNRQYETMTRVQVGGFTVRVWSTVDEFSMGPDAAVVGALSALVKPEPSEIVALLDAVAGVAAFEILDHDGRGGLVYPDWK